MYENILLPTDGSPAMGSIIDHGLHQANLNDATIHVIYVVDVRSYMTLPEETGEHVAQLLKEEGDKALDVVHSLAEDRTIEYFGEIAVGLPHAEILEYVDEHDIDLIVMGTHGRSGDEKRIVGSVAEEVIRNADIPVLIVQMSEAERREVNRGVPEEQQRYVQ